MRVNPPLQKCIASTGEVQMSCILPHQGTNVEIQVKFRCHASCPIKVQMQKFHPATYCHLLEMYGNVLMAEREDGCHGSDELLSRLVEWSPLHR